MTSSLMNPFNTNIGGEVLNTINTISTINTKVESKESNKRVGILLVNLGSPSKPNYFQVARFLRKFLWDKRVVKLPRLIWWWILHLIIIPCRSFKVAKLYRKIWTEEGSPLIIYTQKLAIKLESFLKEQSEDSVFVFTAMTYSNPSINETILKMIQEEITHMVVLPLYPQYSGTTTGAVFDSICHSLMHSEIKCLPNVSFISHYCHQTSYLDALAMSISEFLKMHAPMQRLLFSFHGLPLNHINEGDPYLKLCELTANGVRERLNFPENYSKIAFQSRVGPGAWLKPSVEEQLLEWSAQGIDSIVVVAPSFAVDCLETKEEIEIRTKEFFIKAGGKELLYIPALNDSNHHINALTSLIKKCI